MITDRTAVMEISRNITPPLERVAANPLDCLAFGAQEPALHGLSDVIAAVNDAISSVTKRNIQQTDLRTIVMDDASAHVMLRIIFYDSKFLTHDGTGRNADLALKAAYLGILQQMGCYEDGNHVIYFPTSVESGWGHGV